MSKRPVIGVPVQTQEAAPGHWPRGWNTSQRYVDVLTSFGAVPWLIPLLPKDEATLRSIYDRIDGLFLMGGADVDPVQYGEKKHLKCGPTDLDRDATEMLLVQWAVAEQKPTLAVCRGLQLLNVACGGTLFQDLASQFSNGLQHDHFPQRDDLPPRDYLAHDVRFQPGTRLERSLAAEHVTVNSIHHQGVKTLAPNLVPTAWAPDGLIEGIEGPNGQYLVAVQWHPEELTDSEGQRRLFTDFLAAASA